MLTAADALALHARGFSVFPVPAPRPGVPKGSPGDGKTPQFAWKRFQTERPTAAVLRDWFTTPSNAGIVTGGVSGIVVVDADGPEALAWATRHLTYTPWQVRTARGFHLYYRHPGEPVRNRAGVRLADGRRIALDVRGDGGYVVAPGSTHHTGVRYAPSLGWNDPLDAVPTYSPAWWPVTAAQAQPASPTPAVRHASSASAYDRARRYLLAIPRPEIGCASDHATFYAAARLVRGFALDASAALDLLEEWAGGRHGWDRAWLAHKVQSARRYATEPIGGYVRDCA